MTLTLGIAGLSYYLIEQPILTGRRIGRHAGARRTVRPVVVLSAVPVVMLLVAGASVEATSVPPPAGRRAGHHARRRLRPPPPGIGVRSGGEDARMAHRLGGRGRLSRIGREPHVGRRRDARHDAPGLPRHRGEESGRPHQPIPPHAHPVVGPMVGGGLLHDRWRACDVGHRPVLAAAPCRAAAQRGAADRRRCSRGLRGDGTARPRVRLPVRVGGMPDLAAVPARPLHGHHDEMERHDARLRQAPSRPGRVRERDRHDLQGGRGAVRRHDRWGARRVRMGRTTRAPVRRKSSARSRTCWPDCSHIGSIRRVGSPRGRPASSKGERS